MNEQDGFDGAADTNRVEVEPLDKIHVGAGGTLVVPREDIGEGIEDGTAIDVAGGLPKRIRKPGRREWFMLKRDSELPTRLLLYRANPDAMETEYLYVSQGLRLPITDELKSVRVFQYYSLASRSHGLWIINVNPENRWYESLRLLLQKDAEFCSKNSFRIIPDKDAGYYQIRVKAAAMDIQWPSASTQELLGEALGPTRFITSTDHPVYAELVSGKELT